MQRSPGREMFLGGCVPREQCDRECVQEGPQTELRHQDCDGAEAGADQGVHGGERDQLRGCGEQEVRHAGEDRGRPCEQHEV